MGGIVWIIIVGFVAALFALWLSPGPNNPQGFILTTVLGIVGAFLATFIGQTIGWYRPDQGAGFVAAALGAVVVLFIWNRVAGRRARYASPSRRRRCLSASVADQHLDAHVKRRPAFEARQLAPHVLANAPPLVVGQH